MPRDCRRQMKPPQRPTHLPRTTPSTDQISDLAVGGKPAMGDLLHNGPNALIEGGGNQGFITFRHWEFCLQTVGRSMLFIGGDAFEETAGVVRFNKGILDMDHDGEGSADFAVLMSGVKSFKGSNLIL